MREGRPSRLAIEILAKFEELLEGRGVKIPSADREGREEGACIYGSEYYELEDTIADILVRQA